ncbi:hypothetical protein MRX96_003708 [Rhipicephalus microplus]
MTAAVAVSAPSSPAPPIIIEPGREGWGRSCEGRKRATRLVPPKLLQRVLLRAHDGQRKAAQTKQEYTRNTPRSQRRSRGTPDIDEFRTPVTLLLLSRELALQTCCAVRRGQDGFSEGAWTTYRAHLSSLSPLTLRCPPSSSFSSASLPRDHRSVFSPRTYSLSPQQQATALMRARSARSYPHLLSIDGWLKGSSATRLLRGPSGRIAVSLVSGGDVALTWILDRALAHATIAAASPDAIYDAQTSIETDAAARWQAAELPRMQRRRCNRFALLDIYMRTQALEKAPRRGKQQEQEKRAPVRGGSEVRARPRRDRLFTRPVARCRYQREWGTPTTHVRPASSISGWNAGGGSMRAICQAVVPITYCVHSSPKEGLFSGSSRKPGNHTPGGSYEWAARETPAAQARRPCKSTLF